MAIKMKPLGYINLLNNKQKPVYPMDDFFLNYAFFKKKNWKHLRQIINTYLETYAAKYNKQDGFHFVSENIAVETQYQHYLKFRSKQQTQDMKIDEIDTGDLTYVEFQNKISTKPPIEIRASNYSGLAINKAKDGTKSSQIWLLGENDDKVMQGQAISNFRMVEDNTGEYYPQDVNIMFISLPRLAEEQSLCGELSRFLMGSDADLLSDQIKPIAEMFVDEYENFKENEEVVKAMTILEEKFFEGISIGREEGREEVLQILIRDGVISEADIVGIARGIDKSGKRFSQMFSEVKSSVDTGHQ